MGRKEVVRGPGMIAAEELARFFLEHPLVAKVLLFGAVALRGDGSDVDLVLVTSQKKPGFYFLKWLRKKADDMARLALKRNTEPGYDDLSLSLYRELLAIGILGYDERIQSPQYREITWAGKYREWNEACTANDREKAEAIEFRYFRPPDLFLLPPGWATSRRVRELLPNWPSARPWSQRSFLDVLRLQCREYDPLTGYFAPRAKGTTADEAFLQMALGAELAAKKRTGPVTVWKSPTAMIREKRKKDLAAEPERQRRLFTL